MGNVADSVNKNKYHYNESLAKQVYARCLIESLATHAHTLRTTLLESCLVPSPFVVVELATVVQPVSRTSTSNELRIDDSIP